MAKAIKVLHSTQIDVNLACEDGNTKLVEAVVAAVADFSDEGRVGNSLLQIWKLRFGHKA